MPGKVILGFTKERTFELGLDKRVRVFQVNVGEDLYMQEKKDICKSAIALKDPLCAWLCKAVQRWVRVSGTQSDDMYTNIGDATDMNDAVREVQEVFREFREEVIPLSLKVQGELLRGGGLMVMSVVCSR